MRSSCTGATTFQDQVEQDVIEKAEFEHLMGARGIGNDPGVILYGDKNNWFTASLLVSEAGHADVRIVDGGRQKWMDETQLSDGYAVAGPADYTAKDADESIRVRRDNVLQGLENGGGRALVDVQPAGYSGELMAPPGYEQGGPWPRPHPSAQSIPSASMLPGRRGRSSRQSHY